MRLIDADVLLEHLRKHPCWTSVEKANIGILISQQPTCEQQEESPELLKEVGGIDEI